MDEKEEEKKEEKKEEEYKTCPVCGGSGQCTGCDDVYNKNDECRHCHGTGRCSYCNGTGVIEA